MSIARICDYELIEELGRGDMGIVYKARDFVQDRPVAVKLLQAGARATEEDQRRFQDEAVALAWLDHPHIVQIFGLGVYDGHSYIVMKLIGGPSLDRRLDAFTEDHRAAARLVKMLADAIHHAHDRATLHLDLKPDNVVLDESGEPHLIDFGLAMRGQLDGEWVQTGPILQVSPYMAPEQASSDRRRLTRATDVYGLGAILHALTTGRAPFRAGSASELLAKVRYATPEPPSIRDPWIRRDLEIIILRCLEKEPERRHCSAAALADGLRRYLSA